MPWLAASFNGSIATINTKHRSVYQPYSTYIRTNKSEGIYRTRYLPIYTYKTISAYNKKARQTIKIKLKRNWEKNTTLAEGPATFDAHTCNPYIQKYDYKRNERLQNSVYVLDVFLFCNSAQLPLQKRIITVVVSARRGFDIYNYIYIP